MKTNVRRGWTEHGHADVYGCPYVRNSFQSYGMHLYGRCVCLGFFLLFYKCLQFFTFLPPQTKSTRRHICILIVCTRCMVRIDAAMKSKIVKNEIEQKTKQKIAVCLSVFRLFAIPPFFSSLAVPVIIFLLSFFWVWMCVCVVSFNVPVCRAN